MPGSGLTYGFYKLLSGAGDYNDHSIKRNILEVLSHEFLGGLPPRCLFSSLALSSELLNSLVLPT